MIRVGICQVTNSHHKWWWRNLFGTIPTKMLITKLSYIYTRVFHKWHFAKKKRCNTSTHPSRVYINQIWLNFFPKTSLEGLATWSKKATQGSLFVAKTYFLIIVQPLWIPSGVPRRGCSIFFCPNTLPFFATDTYKLVAQGSLFIWVYSDYLSFSI